jgi:hypothetical protein
MRNSISSGMRQPKCSSLQPDSHPNPLPVGEGTDRQVTPTGTELPADSSGNQGVAVQGGAKSGALSGDSAPIDLELALIFNRWPTLPEAVRQRIVAIVKGNPE